MAHAIHADAATSQDPEVVLGYTGHEHDLELGLINMNARMYDPISARFLTIPPRVRFFVTFT
jgi:RHS repeat-associated protein